MPVVHGLPQAFDVVDYDALVVGAGYAGSVVARELAERAGKKVCVLERRPHIAGNAYDCLDEAGVLIHLYGPHIYHTYDERVHEYLSRFTDFTNYQHRVLANIHGTLMPVPFNHTSLKMAFGPERGEALFAKLVEKFGLDRKVPILELRAQDDPELEEVADYVFENVFLHYTMKQWGQTPDQVDPSVTGRVPVLVGDDDRYFQSPHQGMPAKGYTDLFDHMLDHANIDVFLDVDARDIVRVEDGKIMAGEKAYEGQVVYTGPLDELFLARFGRLPYRSLDFVYETFDKEHVLPCGTVNFTVTEDYTRITEFKYLTGQKSDKTTIMKEYSRAYEDPNTQTPYYAILSDENRAHYERYRALTAKLPNFYPLGRLAEYRYYNMDKIISLALELSDKLVEE